ncbi:hypothetical protein Q5P01_010902 [Channa striata]|uniref:Ig-like domain-containing protein n=1 Tax=Channa striata TaxID=64152 RepID=A0AA88SSX8_CHASR|nr:hypothetical protein Q5P01_010902 [Channa striata]
MGTDMTQSCWLLLTLSLKGILAGDWSVHLPNSPICTVIGSSVVLPCSYDYPQNANETREGGRISAQGGRVEEQEYKVLSEMWCREESRCITPRYVFHSAGIFPEPSYQNRVQYLGQPGTKNCSLRISDLRPSDTGTYVFYLITNHPTEKMPEQRGIQLLVADSPIAVTASAHRSSTINEGATVRLACCSPAAPSTTHYRWYKSSSTTPSHTGLVWNISQVTSNDSGSYYCQIQTGEKVKNSSMLTIDVQYAPRNTVVSVSPLWELHNKLPVTLTCSSDANPPVHIYSWYRGEACLPTADKSFHQARPSSATPTGRNLSFSSTVITAEVYGQHCCVAQNQHGSQTSSVTLITKDDQISRVLLIGLAIVVLLVIMAIVAVLLKRKKRTSTYHPHSLGEMTAEEP